MARKTVLSLAVLATAAAFSPLPVLHVKPMTVLRKCCRDRGMTRTRCADRVLMMISGPGKTQTVMALPTVPKPAVVRKDRISLPKPSPAVLRAARVLSVVSALSVHYPPTSGCGPCSSLLSANLSRLPHSFHCQPSLAMLLNTSTWDKRWRRRSGVAACESLALSPFLFTRSRLLKAATSPALASPH